MFDPELEDVVLDDGETVDDATVTGEVDDDPDAQVGEEVDDSDIFPADDDGVA